MERAIAVVAVLLASSVAAAAACTSDGDCPASAPKCNIGTGACQATCDSNGGDALCAGLFGSAPGNERFCETDNAQGKLGQCVPCLSPDNTACPLAAPVCSVDNCVPCTIATAGACADHGALLCSPADAGGSGACVQCVSAANCAGGNGCVNNVCTACSDDASCSGSATGPRCAGGACVECVDASDCGAGQGCVGNVCTACAGDASCTNSTVGPRCVSGACVQCANAADCSAGQGCVSNVCGACNGDPSCSGSSAGAFCVTGACVECRNAGDCAAGEGCSANLCGSCGGSDANCVGSPGGGKCNVDTCVQCLANTDCGAAANPQCSGNVCVACSSNAGCTGHTSTLCETAVAPNQGRCVQCRSDNASADCSNNAAPQCTNNTCGGCSGATGETACHDQHGGRHCEESNTPPGLNGSCVVCRGERAFAQTDCSSATPLCNAASDTCGPCDTDGSSECAKFGATAVCDNPAGGGSGACVGCVTDADCADPANPHCVSRSCTGCDATTAMHGDESCAHVAGAPACQPPDGVATAPGECRACSRFNGTSCTGTTPACNTVTGGCQLCTGVIGDMGAQASGCASDANGHACEGSGTSVFCGCDSDADCGGATSGRICDGTTHLCKNGCSRGSGRNGCPAGQFCSSTDTGGTVTGMCTMSCQIDADCAAMASMPLCVGGLCVAPPDMAAPLDMAALLDLAVPVDAGAADLGTSDDLAGLSVGGGGCGGCSTDGAPDVSFGLIMLLAWLSRRIRRAGS